MISTLKLPTQSAYLDDTTWKVNSPRRCRDFELGRHKSLQNLLMRLALGKQSLRQLQQLSDRLTGKGIAFLAERVLIFVSKLESFRLLAQAG